MPKLRKPTFLLLTVVATLLVSTSVVVTTENICPSYLASSRLRYTQYTLEEIENGLDLCRKETGSLPVTLSALVPDYRRNKGHDAWSNAYVYRLVSEGKGYVLYSRGANGIDEQGEGDDVTAASKKFTCEQYADLCWSPCEIIKNLAYLTGFASAIALLVLGAFLAIRFLKSRAA